MGARSLDPEAGLEVYPFGVDGLGISELAERAGAAPSTVRFYERIGLLSPVRRAPNGYRAFEETALEELAFVTRAKCIGMTLKDITDLVAVWPSGECQSLQARVRAFLAERIDDVHKQLDELSALERQLSTVLGRLSARDPGPEGCGRGCSCETDLDVVPPGPDPRPWSSSLGPDERGARITEWRALAASATSVEHVGTTVGVTLKPDATRAATLARLCAAESRLLGPEPPRHGDRRRPGDAVHRGEGSAQATRRPVQGHPPRRPMASSRVAHLVVALPPRRRGSGHLLTASSARSLTGLSAHPGASRAIVSTEPVRGGRAAREPATTAG